MQVRDEVLRQRDERKSVSFRNSTFINESLRGRTVQADNTKLLEVCGYNGCDLFKAVLDASLCTVC